MKIVCVGASSCFSWRDFNMFFITPISSIVCTDSRGKFSLLLVSLLYWHWQANKATTGRDAVIVCTVTSDIASLPHEIRVWHFYSNPQALPKIVTRPYTRWFRYRPWLFHVLSSLLSGLLVSSIVPYLISAWNSFAGKLSTLYHQYVWWTFCSLYMYLAQVGLVNVTMHVVSLLIGA